MSRTALLICTTNKVGGTERVVLELARHLGQRDVETIVAFPSQPQCADLLEWAHDQGVQAIASSDIPYWNSPHDVRAWRALRSFVRRYPADVTNLHYGGNLISVKDVAAVRAAGVGRCVVSPHHAVPLDSLRRKVATAAGALLAHNVVVGTPAMKKILRSAGVPDNRIDVVLYGVAQSEGPVHRGEAEELRRSIGIADDDIVLSTVARLEPSKGIDVLLTAINLVPEQVRRRLHLVVVGEGSARNDLQAQAAGVQDARVTFLGRVESLRPVYAMSDMFVLPSHEEGFGLVYVEAGVHGVPSIATRVGGVPYAVEHGESGLLVPDGDVYSLASAITYMTESPGVRADMGRSAAERASEMFSPDLMAQRYESILFGD